MSDWLYDAWLFRFIREWRLRREMRQLARDFHDGFMRGYNEVRRERGTSQTRNSE